MATHSAPPPPEPLTVPAGLWSWFYLTNFFHLSLLAALVALPGRGNYVVLTACVAVFGFVSIIGWATRALIHDTLSAMSLRERLALGFFIAALVVTPVFFRGAVLRDGPLFVVAGLYMIAVTQQLAYRLLAATLVAGWISAYWCRTPADLLLLAGFAASWFYAMGMVRLTVMADRYGVWPGSPVARLARSAAMMCVPALAAGVLVWLVWPGGGMVGGWGFSQPALVEARPAIRISEMPAPALGEMLTSLLVLVVLIAAWILLLYLIRRWLLRRRKGTIAPVTMPGQDANIDYTLNEPRAPGPTLPGLRGAIVKLWAKWEDALAREGMGRHKGETADEFAARLAAERPDAAPPDDVSRLLDLAHYSATNLKPRDVETMRVMVDEEMAKQSMRVQGPAGEMEKP